MKRYVAFVERFYKDGYDFIAKAESEEEIVEAIKGYHKKRYGSAEKVSGYRTTNCDFFRQIDDGTPMKYKIKVIDVKVVDGKEYCAGYAGTSKCDGCFLSDIWLKREREQYQLE